MKYSSEEKLAFKNFTKSGCKNANEFIHSFLKFGDFKPQGPAFFFFFFLFAVQRLDNVIHWINHYPADSVVCFVNTYPLDSDLSGR